MTVDELKVKYEDSCKKVEKRKALTLKAIEKDEHNLDGIMDDFYSLIMIPKGGVKADASLEFIKKRYFPEEDSKWFWNDVTDNLYKLRDLMAVNYNWKVKLDKAVNEENEEKIEVIWNFLQEWRKRAREFFISEANRFIDLKKQLEKELEEYRLTDEYKTKVANCRYNGEYYTEEEYEKEFYKKQREFHNLVKNITTVHPHRDYYTRKVNDWYIKIDEELLDKTLDKDVKMKYKDLVDRITFYAGQIVDAKGLYISNNGEINGIVVGDKNTVKVETIGAGGYNIQIFHYRTLIHIVK